SLLLPFGRILPTSLLIFLFPLHLLPPSPPTHLCRPPLRLPRPPLSLSHLLLLSHHQPDPKPQPPNLPSHQPHRASASLASASLASDISTAPTSPHRRRALHLLFLFLVQSKTTMEVDIETIPKTPNGA
ncbi:hypothetical protein LINGRAHAP2_LOCUS8111, partial [Linum grandiflorum]